MIKRDVKGQIWVETAIYTLIGLTIIGIILSIATPQIEKIKERSIISQTEDALNQLNNEILKVEQTEGSVKIILFKITKGKLDFDSQNNKITYTLENTKLEFSEEGIEIKQGEITYKTEKTGKRFDVSLDLDYESLDLTFSGEDKLKTLRGAGTPYKIRIENLGAEDFDSPINIDFTLA
tara:strand:+ start:20 stop:556 length:537 start_codon:yes stop_codon:yes gene_type:complete